MMVFGGTGNRGKAERVGNILSSVSKPCELGLDFKGDRIIHGNGKVIAEWVVAIED